MYSSVQSWGFCLLDSANSKNRRLCRSGNHFSWNLPKLTFVSDKAPSFAARGPRNFIWSCFWGRLYSMWLRSIPDGVGCSRAWRHRSGWCYVLAIWSHAIQEKILSVFAPIAFSVRKSFWKKFLGNGVTSVTSVVFIDRIPLHFVTFVTLRVRRARPFPFEKQKPTEKPIGGLPL